jgi:hypothetical protein
VVVPVFDCALKPMASGRVKLFIAFVTRLLECALLYGHFLAALFFTAGNGSVLFSVDIIVSAHTLVVVLAPRFSRHPKKKYCPTTNQTQSG